MPKRLLKAPIQIYAGLRDLFSWSFVEGLVPEWFLRITIEAVPKAFWGETGQDQIEGAIILIGWSIATSLFTGGVTVVFVGFFAIFLVIGIWRLSDFGEGAWDSVTGLGTSSLPGVGKGGRYRRRKDGGG